MSVSEHRKSENQILASLPREEYERLLPNLKPIHHKQGDILSQSDDWRHSYFIEGGMASMLCTTQDAETLEVAFVCSEGLVGVPAMSQNNNVHYRVVAQFPTDSLRMDARVLKDELKRGGRLHDSVQRYSKTLFIQITQSALCVCFHTVEQRLCRWLLIADDCARSDSFDLTHECLSQMLGRSRPNVTAAAKTLQQAELIRYTRARIIIVDRAGLETRSCECYRIIRDALDGFLTT